MKYEYHEGPEALERFEKGMTALFRAPKPRSKPTAKEALPFATSAAEKSASLKLIRPPGQSYPFY